MCPTQTPFYPKYGEKLITLMVGADQSSVQHQDLAMSLQSGQRFGSRNISTSVKELILAHIFLSKIMLHK